MLHRINIENHDNKYRNINIYYFEPSGNVIMVGQSAANARAQFIYNCFVFAQLHISSIDYFQFMDVVFQFVILYCRLVSKFISFFFMCLPLGLWTPAFYGCVWHDIQDFES